MSNNELALYKPMKNSAHLLGCYDDIMLVAMASQSRVIWFNVYLNKSKSKIFTVFNII